MSSTVPESSLTSEELLRISGFDRQTADHLDAALVSGLDVTVVEYTATGAEVGTGVTIPIGTTLAAANYHVGFFGVEADAGAIVPAAWSFPSGSKTTTQFVAEFSGDGLTAGAVYKFQIVEA